MENDDRQQEIVRTIRELRPSVSIFSNRVQNQNITVFLGNTRSGKSTLINYLCGNELEAFETERRIFKIRAVNENAGPCIGQGSVSSTASATAYESDGQIYVDCPGFGDNRGILQEITNALFLNMLKRSASIRFVLVADINDLIHDNISGFLTLIRSFYKIVPNYEISCGSVSIIFTKEYVDRPSQYFCSLMKEKIVDANALDCPKELIHCLSDNTNLVGVFKMPANPGLVNTETDEISAAILDCVPLNTQAYDIHYAISDEVLHILGNICIEYIDSLFFNNEMSRITNSVHDYLESDWVFASYDEELEETLHEVEHSMTRMENQQTTLDDQQEQGSLNMQELQTALTCLLGYRLSQEFVRRFELMVALDDSALLNENYKTQIINKFFETLDGQLDKCRRIQQKIEEEMNNRYSQNLVFSGVQVVGFIGSLGLVAGISRACGSLLQGTRLESLAAPGMAAFGACESVVGTAAVATGCVVGAAIAGTALGAAYVTYQTTIGKRLRLRREQGRPIHENTNEE